ncbi:hypothetical protein LO80_03295 [Candidatus Francisella endociliophora]|uniref:DUF4055 domain-containing protein n=1 Tax=Candidatus Francisella endociliophora TaxID=653937 RepID=A0A097ENF0_9GAMM|nr:DUF4055 domain-containing protein [Francisella sp. FSC1006]AIT09090.1 hypothetical protein LO80_03295 [Francisella sp. FSC1006]
MTVSARRDDFISYEKKYTLIDDCTRGQDAIKNGANFQKYLPLPLGVASTESKKYKLYKELAFYPNIVGRTSEALTGLAFRKQPSFNPEAIEGIEYLADRCSLDGEGVTQFSKKILSHVINYGRAGILVDFPEYGNPTPSIAEKEANNLYSYMAFYPTHSIINWNHKQVGAVKKLNLVVLHEEYLDFTKFDSKYKERWRVLMLDDGVYRQLVYDQDSDEPTKTFTPTDYGENTFSSIPFVFCGSTNNNSDMDKPPMLDLCHANINLYRLYADHRWILHNMADPFRYITNISKREQEDLERQGIKSGATKTLMLSGNSTIGNLELQENSSLSNEIDRSVAMMMAMGAKMVKNDSVNESATAAKIKASTEDSVLLSVMGNVSSAIDEAIRYVCMFEGAEYIKGAFSLDKNVIEEITEAQTLSVVLQAVMSGNSPRLPLYNALKSINLISEDMTYEEFIADIIKERESFNEFS